MNIINPAIEEIISTVVEDTASSIAQKYELAKAAQKLWAKVPLKERIACIALFNDLLDAQSDLIAADLTAEVGKPLGQAKGEIRGGRARSSYFVSNSEKYLAEEWMVSEGDTKEKGAKDEAAPAAAAAAAPPAARPPAAAPPPAHSNRRRASTARSPTQWERVAIAL